MTRTTVAVAADYADAMLVGRRWKNLLVLLLTVFLIIQIGVFFFVRFYSGGSLTLTAGSTTQPALTATHDFTPGLAWLTNFVCFLSMVCVVVLAVVLLLIVGIMLVGRLVGVSHVTSAFVWCVLLAALLFPWQSLWNYPVAGTTQTSPDTNETLAVGPRYGLPGALYTWPELEHQAHFSNADYRFAWLKWARFVVWPLVALLILGSVQVRSTRGLRFALGEAELQVASTTTLLTPPGAV
jgi:hypothetical protein